MDKLKTNEMNITEKQYLKSKKIVEEYERQLKNGKDSIELRDTDLSVRVSDRLRQIGLFTIGDVRKFFTEKGIYGLFKLRGFGKQSVDETRILLDMTHEEFYSYKKD